MIFKKLDIEDTYLRKYIKKSCRKNLERCEEILESDEALKKFANLWSEEKESIMLMLTGIEYEFLANREFTNKELAAIRHVVGNVASFFMRCRDSHQLNEVIRAKKTEIKKRKNKK